MSEVQTGQDTPVVDNEVTEELEAAPVDNAEEATEASESETPAEKTFTQAELDGILQKRIARAEAKAERRVLKAPEKIAPQQQRVQEVQEVDDKPRRDQFDDEETYIDRLTDWKLDQRDKSTRRDSEEKSQRATLEKTEKLYAEAAKLDGFDRDDFDSLPMTKAIVQALIDSDVAPKLMAYMSSNPEEVERIAALTEARQAAELGKLEAKLSSAPVKTSKTPAPITPVGSGNTKTRSLANASMDDYMELRRKQKPVWAR